MRHAVLIRGLRQGGYRHGAQGNLADFGGQRQFLAALRKCLDQGAYPNARLGAHAVLAEFQDPIKIAGVDRGTAVAADAASLRIIGADHAYRRGITLGLFQQTRQVLEALQAQHHPRPPIDAR